MQILNHLLSSVCDGILNGQWCTHTMVTRQYNLPCFSKQSPECGGRQQPCALAVVVHVGYARCRVVHLHKVNVDIT